MTTNDHAAAAAQCLRDAESYQQSARQAFASGDHELGHWYAERSDAARDHARDLTHAAISALLTDR